MGSLIDLDIIEFAWNGDNLNWFSDTEKKEEKIIEIDRRGRGERERDIERDII